jgi:amino acid adenylation domain-containing protein
MHQYLDQSAEKYPDQVAVEDECGTVTYRQLVLLSNRLRDRLYHAGVRRGDRVGIYMRKSIDTVAAIFGILKAGAAYVPVDPGAPVARNAYILNNCSVRLTLTEKGFEEGLLRELGRNGVNPLLLAVEESGGGRWLDQMLADLQEIDPAQVVDTEAPEPDDLAYLLYTSGSTGSPKGVMLSHRNASSFIDWCSEVFAPDSSERFSSHAPFHFDLSILDIYVPLKHGATLVLIGSEIGKDPGRLASLIAEKGITSWYSTPSILSLLAQYGKLDQYDFSALKTMLFAGEVFPVKHLRALVNLLPGRRYFNLYGPTETNVCTFYEIPEHIPQERMQPYPIGQVCSHLQGIVVDEQGREVQSGQEGELCISGPGVMQGYWNLPEQTGRAFLTDSDGQRWYKTGDIVVQEADGNYIYVGRRDRMVKKRGYRVELGEIEAGLYRHPAIKEAAVIAVFDEENGMRVQAFLSGKEAVNRPSLIALKRFCAENLPIYMVPDLFVFCDVLPKTSTDKVDYLKLKELAV